MNNVSYLYIMKEEEKLFFYFPRAAPEEVETKGAM